MAGCAAPLLMVLLLAIRPADASKHKTGHERIWANRVINIFFIAAELLFRT